MSEFICFDPLDVLYLRGNRLFGGGVHGHAQMPPWPSLFAGALASRALADAGRIQEVTRNPDRTDAVLAQVLGENWGITSLGLLRGSHTFFPVPADLVIFGSKGNRSLCRVVPRQFVQSFPGVAASNELPFFPVLDNPLREKPETGFWLSEQGLARHLEGELPSSESLVLESELWKIEARLGIALDRETRTAAEGALYTTDAVALGEGVRFLIGVSGSNLPKEGLVRLGGDGRGARISPPEETVSKSVRDLGRPKAGWTAFRMILATPGIFPNGWLPPGVDLKSHVLRLDGFAAKLMAANFQRPQVISGWDLAQHAPKPARKVVPAGSVYWFRVTEGDTAALESLWERTLFHLCEESPETAARRREGFNRAWFGVWHPEEE